MASQIRLVITPDQIKSVSSALSTLIGTDAIDPHAMQFLIYLKKKEMELQLGLVTSAYTKKKSSPVEGIFGTNPADNLTIVANPATLITPENVKDYTSRIIAGEDIPLSNIDKEEIKSFASMMGLTLPSAF